MHVDVDCSKGQVKRTVTVVSVSGASLSLDVRLPYDPHPFVDLLPHPGLKLGRRVSLGVDAEIGGALCECARIDHGADVGR